MARRARAATRGRPACRRWSRWGGWNEDRGKEAFCELSSSSAVPTCFPLSRAAGEGGEQRSCEPGEGANTKHPSPASDLRSSHPLPAKRALTPVFDGLWGEGKKVQAN